jgi:hypothetical protein
MFSLEYIIENNINYKKLKVLFVLLTISLTTSIIFCLLINNLMIDMKMKECFGTILYTLNVKAKKLLSFSIIYWVFMVGVLVLMNMGLIYLCCFFTIYKRKPLNNLKFMFITVLIIGISFLLTWQFHKIPKNIEQISCIKLVKNL